MTARQRFRCLLALFRELSRHADTGTERQIVLHAVTHLALGTACACPPDDDPDDGAPEEDLSVVASPEAPVPAPPPVPLTIH